MSIVFPIAINESYINNLGYKTLWEAKDVLAYFGSIFGALGSVFIGTIALIQSQQANKISDRLLQLEEKDNTPYLYIDTINSRVQDFKEHEVDISIAFKNTTSNVVNILEVEDLRINATLLNNSNSIVPFCKTWTNHYSVLPNQSRLMNFYMSSKKDEEAVIGYSNYLYKVGFLQMQCNLIIKINFANSNDKFIQKFEFFINMACPKDNNKFFSLIDGVENSIEKC
jgi:hypothetical protein